MTYMPPMHYLQPTPGCGCPACAGLSCLERPRFFAGQLLTESELTGEQAYVIAKNRLHNRYLHGPGVVCGLQVVCGDCEGHVTVKAGYAIDPCGNDIVVCADYDFNVIKAIEDCCSAARARRSECDPYAPLWDTMCKDVEETWCVTLRYMEQEARPTTALPMKTESSCHKCGDARCGCGGSCGCGGQCGGSCGCGGGKTAKTSSKGSKGTVAQQAKPGVGLQPGQCEPTRIIETFCIGIVPEAKDWPPKDKKDDGPFAGLLQLAPPGSLLRRILECLRGPLNIAQKYMTKAEAAIIYANTQGQYTAPPSQQYAALCHFRQAVLALYSGNDCSVWCEAAELIGKVVCMPPNSDSTPQTYGAAIAPAVQQLSTL
ncbi:MAG TPA: hypothetical protein VNT02_03350, partial [Burkholderiales bacterium]|nr:hypothetical protein [Burkholderiales bacterium]